MKVFKKREPQTVEIKNNPLTCPVCSNNTFWVRKAQMNSAISTFFKLDWTDRSATCFVCSDCTHIIWFLG